MGALMFQGTGSDVGKSTLIAGLCRALVNRGLRVLPFKPQNMSNNAAVTADGGEIGRAQALQALACRVDPTVDMNPVLLKPQSDGESQMVVRGRMAGAMRAGEYRHGRAHLLEVVLQSYRTLRDAADIVLVEGAGSAAEVNLRAGDIANMGFARAAGVPVMLVGDIDRGGVIASLAGTHLILEGGDRAAVRGFVINKFRGDPALFDDGVAFIEAATGWKGHGVVPWLAAARSLPSEDSMGLESLSSRRGAEGRVVVACPLLPRIANFDDLDPLAAEPGVELVMVPPGRPIPADAALIVLPGSKATLADLATLRREGWDIDIRAHRRRGGRILGLCGGYQMLGRTIADPHGIEGPAGSAEGLGLLDVDTVLTPDKRLRPVTGVLHPSGAAFTGYEMHVGETAGPDAARAALRIHGAGPDGARSADGLVTGTYVHGWLGTAAARGAMLGELGATSDGRDHADTVDAALDEIAVELERCMSIDALVALAREAS